MREITVSAAQKAVAGSAELAMEIASHLDPLSQAALVRVRGCSFFAASTNSEMSKAVILAPGAGGR